MLCAVAGMFFMYACGSNGAGQDEKPAYSEKDTFDIMTVTTRYMNLLEDGQYETAARMLRKMDNGRVLVSLTEDDVLQEIARSEMFPCLGYKIVDLQLDTLQGISHTVKCEIEFFEKPDGISGPNTVCLTLCPVKDTNGGWFLTKAGGH